MKRKKLQKLSSLFMKIDNFSNHQKIQFSARKKENLITFFSMKNLFSNRHLISTSFWLLPSSSFPRIIIKFCDKIVFERNSNSYRYKPGLLQVRGGDTLSFVISSQKNISGQPILREAKKSIVPSFVLTNSLLSYKSIKTEERTFQFSGNPNISYSLVFFLIVLYI